MAIGNILNTAKKKLIETSALKLTPQKIIEFKVADINFYEKRSHFTSVKNKLTRLLSLLQGLTLIFQRMLTNLVMGPL